MTNTAEQTPHRTLSPGLLVLLAGAEARGKDLLIAQARRRYAGDPRLEFPARLQTRQSAHDSEHIGVPRRVFRDIERAQGFAVSWQHADADHGLTAGALEALDAGRIVVIAVPPAAIDRFRAIWPNVEVIPLASDVDAARPGSQRTPHASSVRHSGDIADAVRRFNRVLDTLAARQFSTARG
jgi:ribose 1,5-bisphosphokinase